MTILWNFFFWSILSSKCCSCLSVKSIIVTSFRLSSADAINVIIPYFFYSKGDQKDSHKRVPITAKLITNLLKKAGADHVMIIEPHTPQLEGFFGTPVDALKVYHLKIAYNFSLNCLKSCEKWDHFELDIWKNVARGADWAAIQSALSISCIFRYGMSRDTKWAQSTADFEVLYFVFSAFCLVVWNFAATFNPIKKRGKIQKLLYCFRLNRNFAIGSAKILPTGTSMLLSRQTKEALKDALQWPMIWFWTLHW